jgi:hypothetical protein
MTKKTKESPERANCKGNIKFLNTLARSSISNKEREGFFQKE